MVDFLQYMCSNDVDIPIGHIVHTGMQNQWGGYENDCSVARLAENRSVSHCYVIDICSLKPL